MWSDNNGPFKGKHYQLAETLCVPAPVSSPRPPIMIGGVGEKKTLRLVAQYGDACNFFGEADFVAQKIDVLRRPCDTLGRDIGEIEITAFLLPQDGWTARSVLDQATQLARLGVAATVVSPEDKDPVGWLEGLFEPIMEEFTAIAPRTL
jgi:alkanesulfonate monooxygenase SsuD/methylene tetrahydromethanopterin reductase-like flavin-dependent oxidoreductase (luciferase family)